MSIKKKHLFNIYENLLLFIFNLKWEYVSAMALINKKINLDLIKCHPIAEVQELIVHLLVNNKINHHLLSQFNSFHN